MAVIPAQMTYHEDGSVSVRWVGVGGADSGQPVDLALFPYKSIQAFGTFGGATVTVWVSNVGPSGSFAAARDAFDGEAISETGSFLAPILGVGRYYEPRTAGGTGTNLTIALVAAR